MNNLNDLKLVELDQTCILKQSLTTVDKKKLQSYNKYLLHPQVNITMRIVARQVTLKRWNIQ